MYKEKRNEYLILESKKTKVHIDDGEVGILFILKNLLDFKVK